MARIIGEMDLKMEEALMENEVRNKINREQAKTIDEYRKDTRWTRFKSYIKIEVKIALMEISEGIKELSIKL